MNVVKRKIFYFSYLDLAEDKSGAKSHVEGIVHGLHLEGWDVTLFSACTGNPKNHPKFPFRVILVNKRNFKLINQLIEQVKLAWLLLRWKDEKPDAIYVRAGYTMVVPYLYALWKGIPYFVEINAFAEIEGSHPRLVPLAVKIENWALKHAHGVFLVTKELREYFIKRTGLPSEKFITMPNGCDMSLYDEPKDTRNLHKAKNSSFTVGFLGSFQVRQGVETLLRAVPIVIKKMPNVQFIIAGSGTEEEKYRKIVEELDIEDVVTFTGFVPKHEVASMIGRFDIALAPYLDELRNIPMGSPLKIFNYLAAGRIVITSELPALELFRQCPAVRFAIADDHMDFARVIIEVLGMDAMKRAQLAEKGKKFILDNYTWDKIARKTSDFMLERCGYKTVYQ